MNLLANIGYVVLTGVIESVVDAAMGPTPTVKPVPPPVVVSAPVAPVVVEDDGAEVDFDAAVAEAVEENNRRIAESIRMQMCPEWCQQRKAEQAAAAERAFQKIMSKI